MITLIRQIKDVSALVEGSTSVAIVSVQVSPQVPALEVVFTDISKAVDFVARLSSSDGEQFAASVMKYTDSGK